MKHILALLAVVLCLAGSAFGQRFSTLTTVTNPAWNYYLPVYNTNGLGVTVRNVGPNTTLSLSNAFRGGLAWAMAPAALSYSGTNVTLNGALANVWNLTATNNIKLFATNFTPGYRGWINLNENATGTWLLYFNDVNIKTNGFSITTNASARNVLEFRTDLTGTNLLINIVTGFN